MPATIVTTPSICIPRTLANVSWFQVKEIFEGLIGKGTVERVDIVRKKNHEDDNFCRIFVHFRYWPTTGDAVELRDRLVAGETIKIVYDSPWFWKCSASRVAKPERTTPKQAPYVEYAATPVAAAAANSDLTLTNLNTGETVAVFDGHAGAEAEVEPCFHDEQERADEAGEEGSGEDEKGEEAGVTQ